MAETQLEWAARRGRGTSATSRSATAARSAARSPTPTRRRTCRHRCSRSTTRRSSARRAASGSSRSTGSSRARSRPRLRPTRSSSPSDARDCPTAPAARTRSSQQPASGYAIVGVAAVIARSGGSISHARVALTGVGEIPTARRRSRRRSSARTARPRRSPPPRRTPPTAWRSSGHPRRSRVSHGDGRRLHPPRDRGRPRPLRLIDRSRNGCASSGSRPAGARPPRLVGAVLARDLTIGDAALVEGPAAVRGRSRSARRRRLRASRSRSSSSKPASCTRTMPRSGWPMRSAGPG